MGDKAEGWNVPWCLCENWSNFSSPVANTRPPAVGVSVQSLMTLKEISMDYKRNVNTIIHEFFHSEALSVLIVPGQICSQSRN